VWIVDAMNVIGSRPDGWWRDRAGAIAALVERLDGWACAERVRVIVVLEQPPRAPLASTVVEVAYAPVAKPNSADDEIMRIVSASVASDVTVVTSDATLAERVREAGAAVRSAGSFRRMLDQA
jgi:predicted RNA-binding protein with PIN domain